MGLSPLGFHISHGGKHRISDQSQHALLFLAVFALMFFYWTSLDMFQTARYLALIAIPLFIFGHRVLATLAARR